jgi:RimJ/RimL family protein N-acetyltransferase
VTTATSTGAVIAALEDHGATHIIAGCDMKNVASVRTLRRLGFTLDGSIARADAFWWVRRAPD